MVIRGKITASCAISCPQELAAGGQRGREKKIYDTWRGSGTVSVLVSAPKINDQWRHGWFALLLVHVTALALPHTRAPGIVPTRGPHMHVKCRDSKVCTGGARFTSRPFFFRSRHCQFSLSASSCVFLFALLSSALSLPLCPSLSSSPIVHVFLRHAYGKIILIAREDTRSVREESKKTSANNFETILNIFLSWVYNWIFVWIFYFFSHNEITYCNILY